MFFRLIVFAAIICLCAHMVYVFPFAVLCHLLLGTEIFAPSSIAVTALFAAALIYYFRTHASSPLLSFILYNAMGIGFIALMVMSAGAALSALLGGFDYEVGITSLILLVILCAVALVNGRRLHVKQIELSSPKITEPATLIFVSDIHLGSSPQRHLQAICEKIAPLDYDALMIGGDLFDASSFDPSELAPLNEIEKPIFYVTGNHEYYVKDHASKIKESLRYNLTYLENQKTVFKGLSLIGISDNQSVREQTEALHALIDKEAFNFVLVHQPGMWPHVPEETDFMISGHTHNGQIFPFNWLVRLQFKTVYGHFKRGQSQLYVSSGASCWGPRMRLGTQNEIIILSLKPA